MVMEVEWGRGEEVEADVKGKAEVMLNLKVLEVGGRRIGSLGEGEEDGVDGLEGEGVGRELLGRRQQRAERSARWGWRLGWTVYAGSIITTTIVGVV